MFRSKKTKTEFVALTQGVKDWKDSHPEIEVMGNRLDSVRRALAKSKPDTWAHTHWSQIEAVVFRKWSMMIKLQQSGLRQVGPDRGINIDYGWWEPSNEVGMRVPLLDGITNWFTDKVTSPNLERAWAMAQEQKLQKARQGLA
jgi:hypothetical protein